MQIVSEETIFTKCQTLSSEEKKMINIKFSSAEFAQCLNG